ncbi:MAG: extracellular solute-binding protein [Acidisphaera sp.]|nr:extracellular solute-binding protein [Acidisphaera sp.]
MRSRLRGLLCALALCCGAGAPLARAQEKVSLTLLSSATARPALEAAVAKFHAENTDVSIAMSVAPDASLNVLIPQQFAAGNGADVIVDWPGIYSTQAEGVLARNGDLLDLSDEAWAKSLSGTLRTLSSFDGKVYFAPLVALGFSTTYNQTALDRAGLTIPRTWDDVLAFCRQATAKKLIPYALGAQTGSQNQMPAMAMGATVIDRDFAWTEQRTAGKTSFATSGWLMVFEKLDAMRSAGCFMRPLGTSEDVAHSQLASGRALGFFGPSSATPIMQAMTHDTLTFVPFPATDDAAATLLCVGIGSGLSVNAKTKHPEAARKFLAFLMAPDNVNAYATATSQVPAIPNDAYKPSDQATRTILDAMKQGKTAPLTNEMWPNPRIVPAQRTATQQMLGGGATPADVVKAMDEAWNAP